jgi:hypothetical protein
MPELSQSFEKGVRASDVGLLDRASLYMAREGKMIPEMLQRSFLSLKCSEIMVVVLFGQGLVIELVIVISYRTLSAEMI